ncbi:MAG: Bis(5-nucleosyl)-tetraphosphatase [Myxococcaceae bacterium]|nr:Bis(5-nucleosyl)-tetraphosphatase [Myxococcaceae bacterium]
MTDTVFSKILRGEIPCHKVYEDDRVLAFLDVGPLSRGHTLVIPKEPAATLDALSDESAAAIGRVLPRLCRAVAKATGSPDYNVLQNNGAPAHQAVFHVHFHIIPKPADGGGLGMDWAPAGRFDHADAAALALAISAAL